MTLEIFILVAGTATAAAPSNPAQLKGVRYFPASVVRALGTDAGATATPESPPSFWFPAPGQVELFDGERSLRCNVEAAGSAYLWALTLECGDVRVDRQWSWLPNGTVWTDLLDTPGGEWMQVKGTPLPPQPPPEPEPAPEPKGKPAPSPAPSFATLAGVWVDEGKNPFRLREDGTLEVAGRMVSPALAICAHVQVEPHMDVPCLRFKGPEGEDVAFALLGNYAWVEGVVREAGADGALHYEGWRHGRMYRRATPPPAPGPVP